LSPPLPASARWARVSSGSDSRATSGATRSCSISRSAAQPGLPGLEEDALVALHGRDARTLTVTEVTTPRTPSLPERERHEVGPGGGGRAAAELQRPGRRLQLEADDQLVEAAVAGAGLAGAAGGRVAAEAGVLVGLREVPEGQAVRREQLLGVGSAHAGLEGGGQRLPSTTTSRSIGEVSATTREAAAQG
jgi:hypothetical protein